ncbi:hypothetical protein N8482_02725 [Chitinophagales bacterium]|nr:hypothetical protein [Chitinophagales bacterium]
MYSSKLIQILKTLSTKEMQKVALLVSSPFFQSDPRVSKLFNLIQGHHPNFDHPDIEREHATKVVLGSKGSFPKLRYAMSDLTQLLEQYLLWEHLQSNNYLQNEAKLSVYNERALAKLFQNELERQEKWSGDRPKDINWYKYQIALGEIHIGQSTGQKNHREAKGLEKHDQNLDAFYLATKLKSACEIYNQRNVLANDYEPRMLSTILDGLLDEEMLAIPLIKAYHLVLLTLRQIDKQEHYRALIDLLDKKEAHFSAKQLEEFYIYARNYCTKKVNQGDESFLGELLNLYKRLLEREIIIKKGFLWQWDYLNIAQLSLLAGDLAYCYHFIQTYSNKLQEHHRENAYTYTLASYHFYSNNYDKTLELLATSDFTDSYYYMITKCLLAKTYYELDEVISLFSLSDAFSNYIRRNKKISTYQKEHYAFFVKYLKKMTRMKMGSKMKPEKVKKELNEVKAVVDRRWLNKKLEELIQLQKTKRY